MNKEQRLQQTLGHPITIKLQGIGEQPAIPAEEIQVGDLLSWNYSFRGYKVVAIIAGPTRILVAEENVKTGEYSERILKRGRYVAAYRPQQEPEHAV